MMTSDELISAFNAHANTVLGENGNLDEDLLSDWRAVDDDLVARMQAVFEEARDPKQFFTVRLSQPDSYFEQAYALLQSIFSMDVLSERDAYVSGLSGKKGHSNWIAIGRFWRVSGDHSYDSAGNLVRFRFDPLSATESIASYIEGSYMPLKDGTGRAIAGIGYLVTRLAMQRGKGHGSVLVQVFEEELRTLAGHYGERLELIVLESEADARPFWYRKGFYYPQGSAYMQPPMRFDDDTGEPLSDAVPELLMVKPCGEGQVQSMRRDRLIELVRFLYQSWYVSDCNNEMATERQRAFVLDELLGKFEASLPESVQDVPLVEPPLD